MPMHIFISAGEPSGDLHGGNLISAIRRLQPHARFVGYGGEQMADAGCELHFPLSQLAVMGFSRILAHVPTFLQLASRADRYFRHHRPDAVVLIDYPGFNWWIARRAHFHRIPVFYFIPPQLWAWAGWRVRKMRRLVDHALCPLPFEAAWYRERGVNAHFVGHPYFDELSHQRLDQSFLEQQSAIGGTVIGLLPGSRNQEVERNLPTLIGAAERIHAARPDARFLVASYKESQRQMADTYIAGRALPIATFTGRTPEIIHLSYSCIAVSGSVGLELLYRGKPSVIVYRVSRMLKRLVEPFVTIRYMSLVNLLADRELFPEFPSVHCEAEAAGNHILRWLDDPQQHEVVLRELAELRQRVVSTGACQRAAEYICDILRGEVPARPSAPLKVSA
jgi:lipid-A-disaccharide synthase